VTASADIDHVVAALDRFPDTAVRRAVDQFRDAVRPRLKRDTGGDFRLSGIGNARLNVSTRVVGRDLVEGKVTTGPKKLMGPWRWLDDGTRPSVTADGRHYGTTAKHTWSDPVAKALPDVQAGIARDFVAVVR